MNKHELIEELEKEFIADPVIDLAEGYNDGLRTALISVRKYFHSQSSTPPHYQGAIQPIDLINAQDLNFNLGNVVKYVCRAGKKQGENILTDLEKAKDYINFEIERVKQWTNDNVKNWQKRELWKQVLTLLVTPSALQCQSNQHYLTLITQRMRKWYT